MGWVFLAVACSVAQGGAGDADGSANLIRNGGFEEQGDRPWRLAGARIQGHEPQEGKRCVTIVGKPDGLQRILYDPPGGLRVEPACKYQLGFWIKSRTIEGRFKVRIRQVGGRTPNGIENTFLPGDAADWTACSYEFTTRPETGNVLLDFYFLNARGTAFLDGISLRKVGKVPVLSSEQLTDALAARLKENGWAIARDREHLVAERGGLRTYHRILRRRQYLDRQEWEAEARMGAEVDRLSYHMEQFPIGPAIYGYALYARAKQLGMHRWDYISKVLDDIKAHHMNTVWYGNTGSDKADIERMVALCERKGLRAMMQMSGAYYRCTEREFRNDPEKRKKHYDEVNVPFVRDVMPRYRGRKGVFAWSVKEETRAEYASELAAYYKLVKGLDPTHPILICHNNLEAAQRMEAPYPSILGFDRYYYRASLSGGGYLRTPALAIAVLEKEIPAFYQASLKYRVPFFYAVQGVATYMTGVDFSREGAVGANMERRGWRRDPAANTWAGWLRYYPPEHCMRLQCWTAVALGAKGIFCYAYGEPGFGQVSPRPREQAEYGLSWNTSGEAARQWQEFGETAKDLSHFASLILKLNKRVFNVASADDPHIVVHTFSEEDTGRTCLIVVNKRTGFWCGKSPQWLRPEDELAVDDEGLLTDYRPAPPLEFTLNVRTENDLYDLRDLVRVRSDSSGRGMQSCRLTLPPGAGNVFLVGTREDFSACREAHFGP